jgi:hypothetical protein
MNRLLFKYKLWKARREYNRGIRHPMPANLLRDADQNKLRRRTKDYHGIVVSGATLVPVQPILSLYHLSDQHTNENPSKLEKIASEPIQPLGEYEAVYGLI